MTILEVREDDNRQLQNIANTLAAAKKVVVITGAGISTNCGIPVGLRCLNGKLKTDYNQQDFRSKEGLYSLLQTQRDAVGTRKTIAAPPSRQPLSPRRNVNVTPRTPKKKQTKQPRLPSNIKGRDLFDNQLWKERASTSTFYTFIANLRKTILEDVKRASPTHRFIRTLRDKGKLVRCYTQNIDGLEAREGLSTDMERGKGNRARFTKESMAKPRVLGHAMPGTKLDRGCEVVQLHGDLEVLRCTLCSKTWPWDQHGFVARLLAGEAPTCQSCMTASNDRQDRGQRATKVGTLRPNIVLYGEEHPSAEAVGTITAHDLALSPDLLLVLGTSLHVHGLKVLVREFAKSVHARAGGKGNVIFVNLSRPSESVWKGALDYWVSMDCDKWVAAMKRHRHDLLQVQNELQLPITKANSKMTSKAIPSAKGSMHDNKENIAVRIPSTPSKSAKQITHSWDQNRELFKPRKAATGVSKEPDEQTLLDSQLQLPTPPSTGPRAKIQTPSKKRSLMDNYRDMFSTPSKRSKTTVAVWEDEDVR